MNDSIDFEKELLEGMDETEDFWHENEVDDDGQYESVDSPPPKRQAQSASIPDDENSSRKRRRQAAAGSSHRLEPEEARTRGLHSREGRRDHHSVRTREGRRYRESVERPRDSERLPGGRDNSAGRLRRSPSSFREFLETDQSDTRNRPTNRRSNERTPARQFRSDEAASNRKAIDGQKQHGNGTTRADGSDVESGKIRNPAGRMPRKEQDLATEVRYGTYRDTTATTDDLMSRNLANPRLFLRKMLNWHILPFNGQPQERDNGKSKLVL